MLEAIILAVIVAALILLWRKIVTNEESALAAIAFVTQIMEETRAVIVDQIVPLGEEIGPSLEALKAAIQAEFPQGDVPTSITDALRVAVDKSKALSAARELAETIPAKIDDAIEAVTPE